MSLSRKIALSGILFAATLTLSWLENLIPAVPGFPPGVKLGLSNIVVLFCLYYAGLPYVISLVMLKAGFVFLLRGFTAAVLSLSGGILSITVMILLVHITKKKVSSGLLSISGACAHNLGQLVAASILISSPFVFYYVPILLISGVVMGIITGYIFIKITPYIDRFSFF